MHRIVLAVVVCALVALTRVAIAADASAQFAAAETAFAAGDYREALRLFEAARDGGSTGPSTYYNIGVCEYLLRDYEAAERTFGELARAFPNMRELAEYNRGLALRASGNTAAARTAFQRARSSSDEKIAALANAQLVELGSAPAPRWGGYVSAGVGHDDNVALVDQLVLASGSASSPLLEGIGVLTRHFGSVPLRLDGSGYWVRYADADEFDQSALKLTLLAERSLGAWRLTAGPALGRSTLDDDGFEETLGVDLRLRRAFGGSLSFESRIVYDDVDAGDSRYAYVAGSRRLLRLALLHGGNGRLRVGYDFESNDRADPGVSPSRQRFSISYLWQPANDWSAEASLLHRDSRYGDLRVPRDERLLSLSFAARRALRVGWSLNLDYRWSDNDSTVPVYSYESQRVQVSLSRGF